MAAGYPYARAGRPSGAVVAVNLFWWSIEVFDSAEMPAWRWQESHGRALTEAAITNGAYEWEWHRHS